MHRTLLAVPRLSFLCLLAISASLWSQSFEISSPLAGEIYATGETMIISWDTTSSINSATISFSADGGQYFNMIVPQSINPGDPGWGHYSWNIPNTLPGTPSANCYIKIADYANATLSAMVGPFTVQLTGATEPVIIINPQSVTCFGDTGFAIAVTNGGSGTLPAISAVSDAGWLIVSVNNKVADAATIGNTVMASNVSAGIYAANVMVKGAGCADKSYKVTLNTFSDPGDTLTLAAPAGGEIFTAGDTMIITWWANETIVSAVSFSLSTDNGATWQLISDRSIARNNPDWGSLVWTIPLSLQGLPSSQCIVRAADCGSSAGAVSAAFAINMPDSSQIDWTPAYITLLPRRSFCAPGASIQFSARIYNVDGLTVPGTIAWSTTGGGTITGSGLFTSSGTEGSYSIGAMLVDNPAISSSAVIDAFSSDMTLISPKGGEVYQIGQTMSIEWTTNPQNISSAIVQFTKDGGITWHYLTSNSVTYTDPDWGSYQWLIPADLNGFSPASPECLLKISDYANTSAFLISPVPFSIIEPVAQKIGTTGGIVALADVAKLDIPAGARKTEDIDDDIQIIQTRTSVAPPAGFQLENTGDVFLFLPHGTTFNDSITISIPYTGPKDSVMILRRSSEDAQNWEQIASVWFDDAGAPGMVFFKTTTFSVYAATKASDVTVAANPFDPERIARQFCGQASVIKVMNALRIDIPYEKAHSVTVCGMNGRIIARISGNGPAAYAVPCAAWPAGCYLVRINSFAGDLQRRVIISK